MLPFEKALLEGWSKLASRKKKRRRLLIVLSSKIDDMSAPDSQRAEPRITCEIMNLMLDINQLMSTLMTLQLKPDTERRTRANTLQAVDRALEFAKHRAVPLKGISIKELIHEGHRM